jgi:peptide/nickel transport system substrate-binding protein
MPHHKWARAAEEGRFSEILKVGDPLSEMVGCGPFRIVDYKTDEAITFERNPRYWIFDQDGKRLPYAERVMLRIVPNLDTMYTKFIAGEFDLLEPLQPEYYQDARAKEKDGDFKVVPLGPSLRTVYFAVNQNPGSNAETGQPYVAPWKLKYFRMTEFRRALSHAVDRDAIVDNLLGGRGSPLYAFTPPPNKLWHNPDVPKYPHDKKKARDLLESIGLVDRDGDGIRETPEGRKFSFTLLTNTENNMRVQACTMIQKDLKEVGLDVTPSPMVFTTLVRNIQSAYDWEAFLLGWASGVPPDPLMSKNILLSSGQSHNWFPLQESPATPWEAEMDKLTAEMGQEDSREKRKAIYDRIQVILAEQQPMIFLFNDNLYVGARNRFRNLKPSILRPHTYWNIEEIAVTK